MKICAAGHQQAIPLCQGNAAFRITLAVMRMPALYAVQKVLLRQLLYQGKAVIFSGVGNDRQSA